MKQVCQLLMFTLLFAVLQGKAQVDSIDDIFLQATSANTLPLTTPVLGTVGPVVPPAVGTGNGTCTLNFLGGSGCAWAIPDINQASHWIAFCESSSTTALQIELEGSSDTANWIAISEVGTLTGGGCAILQASIYKKFIRINLLQFQGALAAITVWYSATKNSFPGSGVIKGGTSSQPITFYPDTTFSNTNLKSTPAIFSTTPASVHEMIVGNPNASIVYLLVAGTLGTTPAVYLVPASSSLSIPDTNGIQVNTNSTVACATAASGVGDPGTGCIVAVHLKGFTVVNGQVGANGAVVQRNPYIPQ